MLPFLQGPFNTVRFLTIEMSVEYKGTFYIKCWRKFKDGDLSSALRLCLLNTGLTVLIVNLNTGQKELSDMKRKKNRLEASIRV